MNDSVRILFFLFAGLFSIVSAAADWDWFMDSGKARIFVSLFGRGGARIFYILLGIVIIFLGFASTN
jgi:hypothetical protein